MKIYECRDITIYRRLYKHGIRPFNTRYDNNGVLWLYEYTPLMKAIIEGDN